MSFSAAPVITYLIVYLPKCTPGADNISVRWRRRLSGMWNVFFYKAVSKFSLVHWWHRTDSGGKPAIQWVPQTPSLSETDSKRNSRVVLRTSQTWHIHKQAPVQGAHPWNRHIKKRPLPLLTWASSSLSNDFYFGRTALCTNEKCWPVSWTSLGHRVPVIRV